MKVASTARRIFGPEWKKTFATQSARTGCEQPQQGSSPLLDHLVGAGEQRGRNFNTYRFRCLEIDHQPEASRLLDRQATSFGTFEDTIDITRSSSEHINFIGPIGNQTAVRRKNREIVNCRLAISVCERDDCSAMNHVKRVRHNNKPAVRLPCQSADCAFNLAIVVELDRNRLHSE